MTVTKKIEVESLDELIKLFGAFDENIRAVCECFDVKVVMQDGQSQLMGEDRDVERALAVLNKLRSFIYSGEAVDIGRVNYLCGCAKDGRLDEVDELLNDVVAITNKGKPIKSKTVGQKKYVDLLKKKTITFGIGPAGTGKTYLAVAIAVNAYKEKQVEKIILTRPAVEAGEKLGFLPGDLQEKVNPYLRPLYDALQEMLGLDSFSKMMERGTIEIAPLAYMRGRTLSNAYVILDEAQNTTKEQIKMVMEGKRNPNSHHGVGLQNVISRLKLIYGKKAGLSIKSEKDRGTEVILCFSDYMSVYCRKELPV